MGVDSTADSGWRATARTLGLAVAVLALLGFVVGVVRTFVALFTTAWALPAGLAVAALVAAGGFVLGRDGGLPMGLHITAYLSAIVSVTLLFLGFVWLLGAVLVSLAFDTGAAVVVTSGITLVLAGLAALGLVGAIAHGDTARSWALNLRMAAALLLLSFCTVVFAAALWLLVLVPAVLVLSPVAAAVVATAVAVGALGWVLYREAGSSALEKRADAQPVGPEAYPDLHDRVTRIASQMGVPVPTVAVSERDAPEAIAVGLRPSNVHLVVSTGTLSALDGEELDAVIAHELAHVKNRDAMVMTAVSTPVVVVDGIRADLLGNLAGKDNMYNGLSQSELWGREEEWRITEPGPIEKRLDRREHSVLSWLVAAVAAWTTIALLGERSEDAEEDLLLRSMVVLLVVVLLVARLVSRVIVAVFSRARETVADRTAAEVTGSPAALASALASLDAQIGAAPTEDLREVSSVSAVSILPLEDGVLAETHQEVGEAPAVIERIRQKLFGTHPPTERRIERLERIESEQERE